MRIEKLISAILVLLFVLTPFRVSADRLRPDETSSTEDISGGGVAITELNINVPKFPSGYLDEVFSSDEQAEKAKKRYTYKKYKDSNGRHALTVSSGVTFKLTADIRPLIHSLDPLVWTCDNDEVALINTDGVVTATTPGIAVIEVADVSGKRSDSLILTVLSGSAEDLETFDYIPDFALARYGFSANLNVLPTKKDLAMIFWRMKKSPSYMPSFSQDLNSRILAYNMGTFPEDPGLTGTLTRADLAYALWKYAGAPKPRSNNVFGNIKDVPDSISDITGQDIRYDAVMWAVKERIMRPYKDNVFNCAYAMTREEFTETVYKFAVRYSHLTNFNSRNIFDEKKGSKKLKDNGTWKKITGAKISDTDIADLAMEFVLENQEKHKYKYRYGSNNITSGEVDCSAFTTHIYKTLLETLTYNESGSKGSFKESSDKTKTPYMAYNNYKNWDRYRGLFEYYKTSEKPLKSGIYELLSESDYQYVFVDKYGIADVQHMTVARWGAYLSSLGVTSSGVMKVKTREDLTGESWKWLAEGNYHKGDIITFGDEIKTAANGNPYLYSDGNYKHVGIFAGYFDIDGDGVNEALMFHSSSKIPGSYKGFDDKFSGVMLSDITAFTRLYNEKECNIQIYRMIKDAKFIDPTPTPTPAPTATPESGS